MIGRAFGSARGASRIVFISEPEALGIGSSSQISGVKKIEGVGTSKGNRDLLSSARVATDRFSLPAHGGAFSRKTPRPLAFARASFHQQVLKMLQQRARKSLPATQSCDFQSCGLASQITM
jgi:hypothetical protein